MGEEYYGYLSQVEGDLVLFELTSKKYIDDIWEKLWSLFPVSYLFPQSQWLVQDSLRLSLTWRRRNSEPKCTSGYQS